MLKKRGKSEKKTDWLGREYLQHYNSDGKKSGRSERKETFFGKKYTQHYDEKGESRWKSEQKETWLGNKYTQKYNTKGEKNGRSEKKEGWIGNKYTQHYDPQGNKTDRTEKKEGWFGNKYYQRYGDDTFKTRTGDNGVGGNYNKEPHTGSSATFGKLLLLSVVIIIAIVVLSNLSNKSITNTYQQPITSQAIPSGWKEMVMNNPQYFSILPIGVRAKLTELKCLIPTSLNGSANVISGHFWKSNEMCFAVVCSREAKSSILVFKDSNGNKYAELGRWDDDHWLEKISNKNYYRRQISTVGESYIVDHYQSYGGPVPPKIEHDAIDDGYQEVSSKVYYFHINKWLQLQGAD